MRVKKKFLDELERRKKIPRARGYGPNYISLFISDRKKKKYARDMGIPTPFTIWEKSGGCRDRRSRRRTGQGRLRRRRREHK
jgi:hypothetical protein